MTKVKGMTACRVPEGDTISRQAVIDAMWQANYDYKEEYDDRSAYGVLCDAEKRLEELPSAQPEIMPDGTLNVSIDADIANVGRILLSQAGTQRGGLYYKDEQPEETCDTCKHGYFGDGKCDYCRERYPSHYERRTDGRD